MAILTEVDEAVSILSIMTAGLLGTLHGDQDRQGAALRYAIGDLNAQAASLLLSATLGSALSNCFALALAAGSTLEDMAAVRVSMEAVRPTGLAAVAVANAGIRFALGCEARILAKTTFFSREDVTAALVKVNAAFDLAEEFAADTGDPATYQALLGLHAAVTRDLSERARPLPRMTTYTLARSFPSLVLANRLYGDAGRADELRDENKVIHPAFMPAAGRALSA